MLEYRASPASLAIVTGTIDLNADLGEYDEPQALARDIAIMDYVSSVNIACGGHAGNDRTMVQMLNASAEAGVAAGAHPSYPDRENFGRKSMQIGDEDLAAALTSQIDALKQHAKTAGVALTHVKPHGQLYNDAADNPHLAKLIANVIQNTLPDAAYVGLARSEMATAASNAGLHFVAEGFADRAYDERGRLVPRSIPGAVLESEEERIEQALSFTRGDYVRSICLHSDSDGALASARDIRAALDAAGITVTAAV